VSPILLALFNGVAQGAMIALVALGYTLVFGVLKMINFAHSEVFMMAAYVGFFVITGIGGANIDGGPVHPALLIALAILVSMVFAALLGMTIERVAYRPLKKRAGTSKLARISPLVTAIGVSALLQNLAQLLFTAQPRSYPVVAQKWVIVVVSVCVMALLELLVKTTWFGKGMRALSTTEEAARLMGIRTSRTIALTFALGAGLAAVGAVLYCGNQAEAKPTMGFTIGTQAFVAAVIGGIGSIPGAMLGGLLLGVVAELVKITPYSGGVDVLVFVVLILVLLVRPSGLLGSTKLEKV
jgi:branched-chain amino acid transport system permease protein